MYPVTLHTKLPRDGEKCRLFADYDASSAKEHAAASKLLYPRHSLSGSVYMRLLDDLRAIRTECNERMLAIRAHHEKMRHLNNAFMNKSGPSIPGIAP
jgi:hypothetical protein